MFRDRFDPRAHGEEYWDDIGDSICPPNFSAEYYTSFALVGLAYPEHPAASEWIGAGIELFERNLGACFYESGGYCESVNYHAHELIMLTQLAVALRAGGRRDFFDHPRFKATFGFFLDMLTPPAALTESGTEMAAASSNLNPPADGRAALLANWGNSGCDCSGYLVPMTLAVAAGIYADSDPAYARRLMSAWRLGPQEFATNYSAFSLIALGRPRLENVALELASKLVQGLGVVMRGGDVFAWIKCGPATHHNCRDEGGLVLYAHGAPVIGDFGYHATHQGRAEGGYETWKHTCITFGGRTTSAYLGAETALPPELWRSAPEADLLVAYLPVEYVIPENVSYLNSTRVPRIEHRRFILFVKPHYFVLYDHIPCTTLPSTWWLHALADAVELGPQRARFRGRFGVDLDVQVLLPAPAQIAADQYSVQRHIRIEQSGVGDYLVVLTPLPPGQPPPTAVFMPAKRLLKVTGDWGEDAVLLAPERREIEHEGIRFTGRVALIRDSQCVSLDGKMR
ncbi:MAG: heparinase II/III family protein [Verrucomicrobia bacterium]|nr:heparinase II/III family protein [Verrucomicrobiota bacterium]